MMVHRNAIACNTININATPTLVPSCALPKARQNAIINPPELTGSSVSFPPTMVVAGGAFFFRFIRSRDTTWSESRIVNDMFDGLHCSIEKMCKRGRQKRGWMREYTPQKTVKKLLWGCTYLWKWYSWMYRCCQRLIAWTKDRTIDDIPWRWPGNWQQRQHHHRQPRMIQKWWW